MKRILVIDDDLHILKLIEGYLVKEGYQVLALQDGKDLDQRLKEPFDLAVLDIMIGSYDGRKLMEQVHHHQDIPVIFVSARDDEYDRILGIELGADDYLTKPFSPRELVARVNSIFRRLDRLAPHQDHKTLRLGNLQVDEGERSVKVDQEEVKLTMREFDLLHYLVLHQGQALTREQLIEEVWGFDYAGETRIVDDVIKRLRKKLEGASVTVETVWGYGYKIQG